MDEQAVDLKREQRASRERPRYPYSATARFFFQSMDILAGGGTTLAKARLVEVLAPIPYRAWENRQQARMALRYGDQELVRKGRGLLSWARYAQDNEYWHLVVADQKLRGESTRDPRYMSRPIPLMMVTSWALVMWVLSRVNIKRSVLLNAEFEDHSEHYYAQLVDEHPEWEDQAVDNPLLAEYGSFSSWADVFRRIGLDERDHMNESFVYAGRPDLVVRYEGMPAMEEAGEVPG